MGFVQARPVDDSVPGGGEETIIIYASPLPVKDMKGTVAFFAGQDPVRKAPRWRMTGRRKSGLDQPFSFKT